MKNLDVETWENTYKPIQNHLDKKASWSKDDGENGIMFETYGKELDFVLQQKPDCIWTYCDPVDVEDDDEDNPIIVSGYHLENRIGYFITELPFSEPITVHLEHDE